MYIEYIEFDTIEGKSIVPILRKGQCPNNNINVKKYPSYEDQDHNDPEFEVYAEDDGYQDDLE